MSEFFDMKASIREQDQLARDHATRGEHELETLPLTMLVWAAIGVAVLYLALRAVV